MEFYDIFRTRKLSRLSEGKDRNIMSVKNERFKYNGELEWALCNLMGLKYINTAGSFSSVKYCKKDFREAIKHIRKRLNEIITADDRLLMTVSIILDRLDKYVKGTSEQVNNDWYIIANLLNLVSRLLGYDWEDGKVYRHIVYYQDKEQEIADYKKSFGDRAYYDEFWGDWRIRFETVYFLNKRKLPKNQIARVLNINEKLVTNILKRIEDFEKNAGEKFFKVSDQLRHDFFII